jgi:pyrroline-5-carboxylate reductase
MGRMTPMQQLSSVRVAFIGGGHMARALIGGLIRDGLPAAQIGVGEPDAQARAELATLGVRVSDDNAVAIRGAALAVLAVKPQHAGAVLRSLHGAMLQERPLLLSIAAGLRIADLALASPAGIVIIRAMPNRPALLGAGITALYAPPSVPAEQRELAQLIGRASGAAVWLRSESELDVVTALSGSGPAYFFLLAEEMARAAHCLGLEADTAARLASATLHGAGLLAAEPGALSDQRAAVTSKGGTTERALRVLEDRGFQGLVAAAIEAGAARSIEIADTLGAALRGGAH